MVKTSVVLALLVVAVMAFAAVRGGDPAPRKKTVFGVMKDGQAYSCTVEVFPEGVPKVVLTREAISGEPRVSKLVMPCALTDRFQEYPLRWRIAFDHFWGISVNEFAPKQRAITLIRVPLSELPWPTDQPTRPRGGASPPKEKAATTKGLPLVQFDRRFEVGKVTPLVSAFLRADLGTEGPVAFDLLPVARDRCQLFISSGKAITGWEYAFQWSEEQGTYEGEWVKKETIEAGLMTPFWVVTSGPMRFLATETGALFSLTRSRGEAWTARQVWPAEGRPRLDLLLLDLDRARTFAFGEGFFLELKEEIRPAEAEVVDPKRWAKEPLTSHVREAARFLTKKK
ncbi:MAG TPA: hypothetical protein VNK04_01670 [Gemmataceae bacterium]|nr:hypothetical protein [Gemmataceae bacterium]